MYIVGESPPPLLCTFVLVLLSSRFPWQSSRLFQPGQIDSLGSFQDGGLRYNNPMELAVWECQRIWSTAGGPDLVLSLGTGTEVTDQSPKAPYFRHILSDGFIPRLYRTFMSSLDGERAWRESVSRMDSQRRGNYFRLNLQLPNAESRLDDVKQMEKLRRSIYLQPEDTRRDELKRILCAVLAATFFFELESLPVYEAGAYTCRGFIRCRNDPLAVLQVVNKLYPQGARFALSTVTLSPLLHDHICPACTCYCQSIQLTVAKLSERIDINMIFSNLDSRPISGFPRSMNHVLSNQSLDAPFGSSDHGQLRKLSCPRCREFAAQQPKLDLAKKRRTEKSLDPQLKTQKKRMRLH